MRLTLTIAAALAIAAPAGAQRAPAAQQPPQPSVEGYLCSFAGRCGTQAPVDQPEIDAPETKGFRIARPTNVDTPAATTRMPARTRAASPSYVARPRAAAATVGAGRRRTRSGAAGLATAPRSGEMAVPGGILPARRRADLMIGFELNSAELTSAGRQSADIFAQSMLRPELATARFGIEGHTDLRGARALNKALSERRAQAVVDYLASRGVDRSRLVARGFGPDQPLAGHRNTDPLNRRVEAELLP